MREKKALVTVVIPCYNEAEAIGKVVRDFQKHEFANSAFDFDILVVDNNSSDGTGKVAEEAGARVIYETKRGKGNAMRTGFANIDPNAEYIMMLDGDDTYRPEEALRMLEPIASGFCNVIIGSRIGGKITEGAMSSVSRGGNWFFAHLVRLIYRVNLTDVFSGYYAWKRSALDELAPHLRSNGFAIEMEMITKMSRMGCEIYSVPISLNIRKGISSLRPIHDGWRVLKMFTANLTWHKKPGSVQEFEEEV